MTFKRKVLIFCAVSLVGIGALFASGAFTFWKANDHLSYTRAIDVMNAYEGRNAAVVFYFDKVRKDEQTATKIKELVKEANALGKTIRTDFSLAEPLPFTDSRAKFDRFVAIQCEISKTVDDQTFRRSNAWVQVAQRTSIYNTQVQNNFSLYERTFGSKKLLFRDCPA